MIDGHKTSAYLKSVEGGHVKTQVTEEAVGHHLQRIKHLAVTEIEPITIDFGLAGAKDILKWIQDSWRRQFSRRNGQITHANFDMFPTYETEFFEALVTETVFPALDGNSKDPGYLKIKVQPERVSENHKPGTGTRISGTLTDKQKQWNLSSFRFHIEGIDEMKFTNHIDSFTIKQGFKKLYTGLDRFPQIEPTKIDFPNITGTIAQGYTEKLIEWHKQTNYKDEYNDPKTQKHGYIEFLGTEGEVLFRLNLDEIGLVSLSTAPSTANSDQIKRTKFELFVGVMDIDGDDQLGLA
jgi:hypothetical protein